MTGNFPRYRLRRQPKTDCSHTRQSVGSHVLANVATVRQVLPFAQSGVSHVQLSGSPPFVLISSERLVTRSVTAT